MRNSIFAVCLVATLFGCNQAEKKQSDAKDSTTQDSTITVNNIELKDQADGKILDAYIVLKDALVKTDDRAAADAAKNLQPLLVGKTGFEDASTLAEKIAQSTDVKDQRVSFTKLSTDMIASFKKADLTSGTIYVQHCPMANDGDGGDWLSKNKEVKNPYYGDKMLTCGSVIEEIKTK